MDGDVAVTQLAAEVRQVLLATTVDIEQRWQFLTPQDRVAAVSDVVFVAVLYNRLFADGVGALDALSSTFGKNLEDAATTADEAVLGIGLLTEDVVSLSDAVSRLVDYVRAQEDSVEVYDAVEVYLTLIRDFSESVPVAEQVTMDAELAYDDTATTSDAAAKDFLTQVQELVATAEEFALTVDFARTVAETTAATDVPAKTLAMPFADVGGSYVVNGYWEPGYTEEGTGPAVYDTFSYTLN